MKRNYLINALRIKLIFLFFINVVFYESLNAQLVKPLRFAFYNLENFFDIYVDSTRDYNEFTPDGEQHWNYNRFITKRNNIYKTMVSLGQGNPPALFGFCELENEFVISDLLQRTPLRSLDYKIVHYESRDRRGIDVAIIYRKEALTLLSSSKITVNDPWDSTFRTRDILFAAFQVAEKDTVYVYINHWPSRYGGQLESVDKRMLAATTLRKHTDSIRTVYPNAKIVMMGDLNDSPIDDSILKGLKALPKSEVKQMDDYVNLFTSSSELGYEGTLKHLHSWQIFDQIIITQPLLNAETGLRYIPGSAHIFAGSFLFVDDERYLGKKLFRTYTGPTYIGGFSDHLPVYIDLQINQ